MNLSPSPGEIHSNQDKVNMRVCLKSLSAPAFLKAKKNMTRIILFLSFALLWALGMRGSDVVSLPAERIVCGVVTDTEGNPLAGASVVVEKTNISVGTNTRGEFKLTLQSTDAFTLKVSCVGFSTVRIRIDSPDGNIIKVSLRPSDSNLDEVVVTGTRSEHPLKDVPVITRVISREEIAAINPPDLTTLLENTLPGIQFFYNSMSQATEITYQGMDSKAVLFLIDGERISGEGGANNIDYNRFNIDNIERVEVVRGAASTLYDSRAIGGVINIITKKSLRPFDASVRTRYAGFNGESYAVSAGVNLKRFSSLTSYGFRRRDTYTIKDKEGKTRETILPDGTIKRDTLDAEETSIYGYRIMDLSQKFVYRFTDRLSLDLRGSYYGNTRPSNRGKRFHLRYDDLTLSGKLKWHIDDCQSIDFSFLRDVYVKNNVYDLVDLREKVYRNINDVLRLYYTGTFGRHTLSGGIDFARERLKHYFMKDTADVSMNQFSACIQEDWHITDNLNIVLGFRADKGMHYNLHFTPKLSLLYRPIERITLRAGYSRGYRMPNLKELYQEFNMGGIGIMMYGNKDLKPEEGSQISVSAEYNFHALNVAVSTYHNRYKNKIAYEYVDPEKSYSMRYVNALDVKTTGIEATANYRTSFGLSLSGAYAYVYDYNKRDGYNMSWLRPHSARLNLQYKHKFGKTTESISINNNWASRITRYSYDSKAKSYIKTVYDPRTVCSVNLRSELPRGISLGFMIDNLFNFKDTAADSAVQLPYNGITYVATLSVNIADMFRW